MIIRIPNPFAKNDNAKVYKDHLKAQELVEEGLDPSRALDEVFLERVAEEATGYGINSALYGDQTEREAEFRRQIGEAQAIGRVSKKRNVIILRSDEVTLIEIHHQGKEN